MNRIVKPWVVCVSVVIASMVSACGVEEASGAETQSTQSERTVHEMVACSSNAYCSDFSHGGSPYCCTDNGGASFACWYLGQVCTDSSQCSSPNRCDGAVNRCVPSNLNCMAN